MRALDGIRNTIERFIDRYPQGVFIIWGCTAAGKTGLSVALTEYFPLHIISADAWQVYKYLDIATSKVDIATRKRVPHYCIDMRDPADTYSAGDRKADALDAISTTHVAGAIPCIVGGTGLYIDMLYKNYNLPDVKPQRSWRKHQEERERDQPGVLHKELIQVDPTEAAKHHPHSMRYIIRALEIYHVSGRTKTQHCAHQPVDYPLLMLGLRWDKPSINRRINMTVNNMVAGGLIDEGRWLLRQGYTLDMPAMHTIGYREVADYLSWRCSCSDMIEMIKRRTHAFAKKQRTRFRRYIRDMSSDPKQNVVYAIYDFDKESSEIVGL